MSTTSTQAIQDITQVELIVGMEVHVELATRTKMFSRALSPARVGAPPHEAPNTLIDPVVLALPGALPVINREALDLAMLVGLALGCRIATLTKWDRKSYFYPDLPKAYQISQYDLPVCHDGAVDLPALDDAGLPDPGRMGRRVGIVRAHLEEDAGKLLHEAPGGFPIDFSIADYNRAGTALLEIVTQPDLRSSDEAVQFARLLRDTCRFLGASEGVLQQGHMRFEPNINCRLTLVDGRVVATPIVEVKNLNSFKALKGAIDFEHREQPARWQRDGRVHGMGMKVTRGWDDALGQTFVQREKEDAHDYRYFPDPDLPPVRIDGAWVERVRERLVELPQSRLARFMRDYALPTKEAGALVEERDVCLHYERAVDAMVLLGTERPRAGKAVANILLQSGFKRAKERGVLASELGVSAAELGALAVLREQGRVNNQGVDELFGALCERRPGREADNDYARALADLEHVAAQRGLLVVRDEGAMRGWIAQVLAANPKVADDVRAGKLQAAGRLVGEVMKLAGGAADAKAVREAILKELGAG